MADDLADSRIVGEAGQNLILTIAVKRYLGKSIEFQYFKNAFPDKMWFAIPQVYILPLSPLFSSSPSPSPFLFPSSPSPTSLLPSSFPPLLLLHPFSFPLLLFLLPSLLLSFCYTLSLFLVSLRYSPPESVFILSSPRSLLFPSSLPSSPV